MRSSDLSSPICWQRNTLCNIKMLAPRMAARYVYQHHRCVVMGLIPPRNGFRVFPSAAENGSHITSNHCSVKSSVCCAGRELQKCFAGINLREIKWFLLCCCRVGASYVFYFCTVMHAKAVSHFSLVFRVWKNGGCAFTVLRLWEEKACELRTWKWEEKLKKVEKEFKRFPI